MKSLLFIGHDFHRKTKSSQFFIDILSKNYEISFLWFDPYTNHYAGFDEAKSKEFDVLFIWQIIPDMQFVSTNFKFDKAFFAPMYDAVSGLDGVDFTLFLPFYNFGILCFSKVLWEGLVARGYDALYVQYFPKPKTVDNLGKCDSVFFWQRITNLNIKLVVKLIRNLSIKHIHIHKAVDPKNVFIQPDDSDYSYTYSDWFDNKDDMRRVMNESSLYIAPRFTEGIGMSFLDAMANGRLVIAPDMPTMNEYIEHGKTGLLYDMKNPAPLDCSDIRKIQKNAHEYIRGGYEKWLADSSQILSWMNEFKHKEIITISTSSQIDFMRNDLFARIEKEKARSRKFVSYFNLLSKWIDCDLKEICISDFFIKNGIHSIAVYGLGKVGKLFCDMIAKEDKIKILYGIDKNINAYKELAVYRIEEWKCFPLQNKADAVVVTVNYDYDDIREEISKVYNGIVMNIDCIFDSEFETETVTCIRGGGYNSIV